MSECKVSINICSFNRKEDLRENLLKLREQTYKNYEIIVVDNASTDGTAQMVRVDFQEVNLIVSPQNLGVIGGRNLGIANSQGEILIFIDDDATLAPDAVEKTVKYFSEKADVGLIEFQVIEYPSNVPVTSKLPCKSKGVKAYIPGVATEGACAIKKAVFEKIGYYPYHLFRQAESIHLLYPPIERGYFSIYCPDIVMYHKFNPINRNRNIIMFYRMRNEIWLLFRYLPLDICLFYIFWKGLRDLWSALREGTFLYYVMGIGAAIIGLPRIINERKPVSRGTVAKIEYLTANIVTDVNQIEAVKSISIWKIFLNNITRLYKARRIR